MGGSPVLSSGGFCVDSLGNESDIQHTLILGVWQGISDIVKQLLDAEVPRHAEGKMKLFNSLDMDLGVQRSL